MLTFAAMALFFSKADFGQRHDGTRLFAVPTLAIRAIRAVALAVFVVSVLAGFIGVQDPYRNLITTMVWVTWWVGFAFVCALVGDLWALASPLRIPFKGFFGYPRQLGAWPAVVLFFAFAWAELVWRDKDVPMYLAAAVLGYAVLAWGGMLLFGTRAWLRNGEAFSIAFGVFGRFAPLHGRDHALHLRLPGAGLIADERVPVSIAVFVLLMLSSVTCDGFFETPLMRSLETAVLGSPPLASALFAASEWGLDESQLISTATLAAFPALFVAAFWLTAWAMLRVARQNRSVNETACAFVLTLVPIAVAYHLAHYFSLLVTAGQFMIPLASDPFGFGWNLFGTAGYKVDLGAVSPYVFWYGAVILIVTGHVIAVVLAHVEALRLFGSPRVAAASQVPMVALMVGYTMLSLWIFAQPIVG
ncbi:MAG TPA: hypothetical protein VGF58_02225 [Burkholderiales bacterium]